MMTVAELQETIRRIRQFLWTYYPLVMISTLLALVLMAQFMGFPVFEILIAMIKVNLEFILALFGGIIIGVVGVLLIKMLRARNCKCGSRSDREHK